jgi:hypothetical protein
MAARQFRRAAMQMADYVNGEQFWPKYALLTHAIELALKPTEAGGTLENAQARAAHDEALQPYGRRNHAR